jgi:uncharacterized membrane protein
VTVAKRGTLRASDADREQIIDRLRKASAEGRLAAHELEHRVATALKARTYSELDATVADLPSDRRAGRRSPGRRAMLTVQAHPALLLVAIPVALVVVAVMMLLLTGFVAIWALSIVLRASGAGGRGYGIRCAHRRGLGARTWGPGGPDARPGSWT